MSRYLFRSVAITMAILWSLTISGTILAKDILPLPAQRVVLDLKGDPQRPAQIKVILELPAKSGPFPLVLWNHGSSNPALSIDENNADNNMAVYYFLSRGYAVGIPVLRGFGGTGGVILSTGCRLDQMGRNAAADIEAVIDQLVNRPEIDARHILVAGSSMGGWNSLAVGASRNARATAIVNFYGGIRSSACRNGDEALKQGSRNFGASTHIPSLWLYGDNDSFWPKSLWAMYREYTKQGAHAKIIDFGTQGEDSHKFLSDLKSPNNFAPKVDDFLAENGLAHSPMYPEYLPLATPQATHWASITDVDAVPFLNDAMREYYKKFLTKPLPRAFVIAPNKGIRYESGGFDPLARALSSCRQNLQECWLYAVDDEVVWNHPTPAPPATQFAKIDNIAALPYVNDAGREGYKTFLSSHRPRAFVIALDGSWSLSVGGLDPVAAALVTCSNQTHSVCRAYAVDGSVVWVDSTSQKH